jgi:hypothetical protein
MPYATDDDLTTRHAAALTASLALRTVALADAEQEIDADAVGGMTVKAHCLLAMYELTVNPDSPLYAAESAPVLSRSAGEISVSYAAPADEIVGGPHSDNRYGRRFDALMAKVIHTLTAV